MSDEKREFRGIWFPASVWLDNNLTAIEKFILMEIDSLDGENGCYASNDYLAGFCQCSTRTVSQAISKLKALGYIEVKSFDGRKRVLRSCLAKSARQPSKICEADSQNLRERILDKVSSTEKDSMSEKKSEAFEQDIRAIIDHFNERCGTRYTYRNKAVNGMIRARLSEGFTVEDFKTVIDTKAAKWENDQKMRDYLRPKTLFSATNFESYLNESPKPKSYLDSVDWAKYELESL